jgi:hypothetical protein
MARGEPGTGFDRDFQTLGDQGLNGVGQEGNSSLSERGFFQNCKTQDVSSGRVSLHDPSAYCCKVVRQGRP